MFESLENRRLFSVVAEAYSETLFVWGDSASNGLHVEKEGSDLVVKEWSGGSYNEIFRKADNYVKEIRMYGGAGADVLTIADNVTDKATIMGGPGMDYLKGGGGWTELWGHGNYGSSPIHGAASDDAANDILVSGPGLTIQYGQKGNDLLFTDNNPVSGNDFLNGGDGNDQFLVQGHGSSAYCIGGKGGDTFRATQTSTQDAYFYGHSGYDVVDYTDWTTGVSVFNDGASMSGIRYGAKHQVIQTDIEAIKGTEHDDFFFGTDANDTYYGYGGKDTMYGFGGADILIGGDDKDYLYGGDGNDFINGQNGDDEINGDGGHDILYGGEGDDHLRGDAGNDSIYGQAGNDWIYGNSGNDKLVGGTGADHLISYDGVFGNDVLFGDNENGTGGLPGEIDIAVIDETLMSADQMFGVESYS